MAGTLKLRAEAATYRRTRENSSGYPSGKDSVTSLKRARSVLFIVLAIALAIPAVLFIDERAARWMSRVVSPLFTISPARIAQLRNPVVFAALSFGWSLVVGIALIAWMRAAYEFARNRLRVRDVEYRSWVFWSWMIPVINLYKPCQVLREIHRCGHPSAGKMPLGDLRSSAALVAWWIFHRALHFLFIASLFILVLSASSGIPLSPFGGLPVQAKWTAGVYVVLTLGWFVVAGALTARLGRHPAYAGDAAADETEEEREFEPDADDWSGESKTDEEVDDRNAYFSSAYRREPQIGEPLETESEPVPEVMTTTRDTAMPAAASRAAAIRQSVSRPEAMPATRLSASSAAAAPVREAAPPQVMAPAPIPAAPPAPMAAPLENESGFDEAAAYERIAEELDSGKREKGTWLRAVVESGADEARQPVLYAQLRLRQLRLAHDKEIRDLAERHQLEEQERIASEKAAEQRRDAERYLLDAFHHQDALTLDGPAFLDVVRVAAEENRVNQRSRSNGKTLLHMAVERVAFHTRMSDEEEPNVEMLSYDREAIRILLDAGADPGLRDRNARSAHDYARAVGVPLRQMV